MDAERANIECSVTASLLQWMTVHGYLCLALRHPGVNGPSRALALDFVEQLSALLVEGGIMTRDEMTEAHQVEIAERPS